MRKTIPATQKINVGVSLIYFKSITGPILISTKGVFFVPQGRGSGFLSWSTLDFMRNNDLANDETIRVERDYEMLNKSVPYKSQGKLAFGLWLLTTLVLVVSCQNASTFVGKAELFIYATLSATGLIWAVPLIALILSRLRQFARARQFKRDWLIISNVIAIGSSKTPQKIHFGNFSEERFFVECINIALTIFRKQQSKYGPISD